MSTINGPFCSMMVRKVLQQSMVCSANTTLPQATWTLVQISAIAVGHDVAGRQHLGGSAALSRVSLAAWPAFPAELAGAAAAGIGSSASVSQNSTRML